MKALGCAYRYVLAAQAATANGRCGRGSKTAGICARIERGRGQVLQAGEGYLRSPGKGQVWLSTLDLVKKTHRGGEVPMHQSPRRSWRSAGRPCRRRSGAEMASKRLLAIIQLGALAASDDTHLVPALIAHRRPPSGLALSRILCLTRRRAELDRGIASLSGSILTFRIRLAIEELHREAKRATATPESAQKGEVNMNRRAAQPQPTRRLEMGLAFVFGCVALAAVLWLAFSAETLNQQQFEILRIVLALAGGGIGAVIPGVLDVSMKASTKLVLRAGGALAVFVVLYFWSPSHWQPSHEGTVIQHTEGPGSPIQSGNGNRAIYNGPVK
jgi:hypothetical protein